MNKLQLLTDAKNTVFNLKQVEQRSINPYASFANQMIQLIDTGKISSWEDVVKYTGLSYPRPGLNRQWRKFGEVLEKNQKKHLNKDDIAIFFGYLKRLLTIEGKKQYERTHFRPRDYRRTTHKRFKKN